MMTEKIKGNVKSFNDTKGYGFIKPENMDQDVFVHATQLAHLGGTLQAGQTVLFEAIKGRKGIEATNIEII